MLQMSTNIVIVAQTQRLIAPGARFFFLSLKVIEYNLNEYFLHLANFSYSLHQSKYAKHLHI